MIALGLWGCQTEKEYTAKVYSAIDGIPGSAKEETISIKAVTDAEAYGAAHAQYWARKLAIVDSNSPDQLATSVPLPFTFKLYKDANEIVLPAADIERETSATMNHVNSEIENHKLNITLTSGGYLDGPKVY